MLRAARGLPEYRKKPKQRYGTLFNMDFLLLAPLRCGNIATILDKTVGKVSTFEVFIASLPSPLLQCCAKLNGFSGKLLTYLPTLNRGEGGYVRESETISFEL